MPQAFRRVWPAVWLVVASLLVVVALRRLGGFSLTTDELLEYQGVVDHVHFAQQVLRGAKPDLHEAIVYNLENYGIIAKLPAYLISRLAGVPDPVDDDALTQDATPHQLYFQLSHLTALLMGLGSSALLILVARGLRIRQPWAAGLILLLIPRFIGDSFFNIKDIPFAFFYLLYSTSLFLRLRRLPDPPAPTPAPLILLSALAGGLMGSMKIVALVPVLIAEALVAVACPRRCRWLDGLHISLDALMLALLFTPSSWLEPLRFLNGAIKLFRSHDWPGGTWWNGVFLSRVQDPLHWSTAGYLLRWLPSVTPLWVLVLALAGAWSLLRGRPQGSLTDPRRFSLDPRQRRLLVLPFLLQLLLLPTLAVVGNANLYDGVRHVLFIFPPLALLAALGLEWLSALAPGPPPHRLRRVAALALALMALLTLWDGLTLAPYAYVYVNEPMRFVLSPANTAYDYWVYAGSDATRAALARLPGPVSARRGCLARVELPDSVRATVAPRLRALACPPTAPASPPAVPLVLRLASVAEADRPGCQALSRWQWPWLSRTLSVACLDPLPVAPPPP